MNALQTDVELIALIERVAQQDKNSLKHLYDATSSRMYGLALRIVGNREWAEDVLQEAYLSIWKTAANYNVRLSPPLAWLGLIVRSRALDLLRKHIRQGEPQHLDLDDDALENIGSEGPTPQDRTQLSEQAWALNQCLEQLDSKQRQAVSLAYLQDLSHSELAVQMRTPLGTIKTWIRRGIEQLRGCMAAFG
jgi:RNA polymerase sigma factor (sigma-70 family)